MLRKIFFILSVLFILNPLFASPTHALSVCPANYTCVQNIVPDRDCIPREADHCQTPSGDEGSWCCSNPPTVSVTPTIIPSCIRNGNRCIPNGESCEPGETRGTGGICQSNFVCCALPLPTIPPGGAPPPVPLPTFPTNFTTLEYPCDQTTDEEFHPLRPYPGSPCDPLIPRKQEPEYLSFACGKSLNTLGEYRVSRQFSQDQLDNMSTTFSAYGEPYRCGAQVCIRKRSIFDITLDLSPADFPVLGNTQDPLDDATKANNYLSWYLTGTNPTWLEDTDIGTPGVNTNTQCIGSALGTYMNAILAGTTQARNRNVRLTSPAFNLTNPIEQDIFIAMETSGAEFDQIDAFAGNTYTLNGIDAFKYVTDFPGADGRSWRDKFTNFNKPIIFTEFGDFATFGDDPEVPNIDQVIVNMRNEFIDTAGEAIVKAIVYFNAFGGNPQFIGHKLADVDTGLPNELYRITSSNLSKAGVNSATGVNSQFIERIARNSSTWSVELILSPGDVQGAINSANMAHRAGITPVFRPCYGNSCGFADPQDYVNFINQVAQRVDNQSREIWFIAGPNEPAGETWAAPSCATAGVPTGNLDRFLTYSGPIKKLLSQDSLDLVRYALKANVVHNVHNYTLDETRRRLTAIPTRPDAGFEATDLWASLFSRIPLATMEDVVGEVNVGLITSPRSDGSSPQPIDVIVVNQSGPDGMRLQIKKPSDSRLYFPHIKTVKALSDVLIGLTSPKGGYRPGSTVGQRVVHHQGSGDNASPVQIEYGEGGFDDDIITRNTEVYEDRPAPPAVFGQEDHFEFDQRCDLTGLQVGEGDHLFGKSINGTLTYSHELKFDPIVIPANCGGGDLASCTSDSDPTQGDFGKCCPQLTTRCEDIDDTPGYDWRCTGGMTDQTSIPTEARVGVFTKTPFIDEFYGRLITNADSFLRYFIPSYPTPAPGEQDLALKQGALALPVKTQVGYSASAPNPLPVFGPETVPDNPHAGAGNNTGGAEIYFPRLGSLVQYFLGSPSEERFNFQKLFRPKDFGSLIPPGGAGTILAACQPYLSNFPGSISVTVTNPSNVFSKVGDSITVSTDFLRPFGNNTYTLGNYGGLQAAISFYDPTSFTRPSKAAGVGWNSNDLVSNSFAVLNDEYTEHKPAIAIIMIGTNDSGGTDQVVVDAYSARLRSAITYTASRGIVPIISTLPYLLTGGVEGQQNTNTRLLSEAVKQISTEMGVPLIDYRLATEDFIGEPNWGISTDNIHPFASGTGATDLTSTALSEGGYNVRNFVTMCALDAVWKTRFGGGGTPPTGETCTYSNSEVESAFAQAAARYGVPVSMLRAVHGIESFPYDGSSKTFVCENNEAQAAGPMQIVRDDVDTNSSTYHFVTCSSERTLDSCDRVPGKLSRCNVYDAAELAARVLLSKVDKWDYDQCRDLGNISETNIADVYNASCQYYGVYTADTATDARGRDFPSLPARQDGRPFNYCDVVCGRMKQDNPALNYCPAYPAQRAQ